MEMFFQSYLFLLTLLLLLLKQLKFYPVFYSQNTTYNICNKRREDLLL